MSGCERLRIVDPACGSGVFLIMAFDFLKAELTRVNDKIAALQGRGTTSTTCSTPTARSSRTTSSGWT